MPIRPDLMVYTKDNEPSVVVEVKNKRGASSDWASQFRRNLLMHGGFPPAPFFLLVTPDQLYLWKDAVADPEARPTEAPSTRTAFQPFLDLLPSDELDELSLELVTQAWLSSLAELTDLPDEFSAQNRWLIDSGLYESVRGGHIELEPAA